MAEITSEFSSMQYTPFGTSIKAKATAGLLSEKGIFFRHFIFNSGVGNTETNKMLCFSTSCAPYERFLKDNCCFVSRYLGRYFTFNKNGSETSKHDTKFTITGFLDFINRLEL
jgi:hypothetical protein